MITSEHYHTIRQRTLDLCESLEVEDYAVQPSADVSPIKWHLGHTTWFFEEIILAKYIPHYSRFNAQFSTLFNSYYKAAGCHWRQSERGHLSRPTVKDMWDYRLSIDNKMAEFLTMDIDADARFLIETGLNHEQQHQELIMMDIKYILAANPLQPSYTDTPSKKAPAVDTRWYSASEGVYDIGFNGNGFAYDNETPVHKAYLPSFDIRHNLVTNGEYLHFIKENGYQNPLFWLSQGWDWVTANAIIAPLYWRKIEGQWYEFTLHGLTPLDVDAPVMHISYFEADAFTNWAGLRLPTEQESELFLRDTQPTQHHAWWWTQSHYSPYPGFKKFDGILKEYNGKFMCNQFVLKGGCPATPAGHLRATYRNFYYPHQRWMFSGLRLGQDV